LFSGLGTIVLLFVLLFSQQIREELVRAAYRPKEKTGAGTPHWRSPRALIFPSSQPPRVFSQACSQGATVGGLCGGERSLPQPQAAQIGSMGTRIFH